MILPRGMRLRRQLGKAVLAAGDINQFGDPADAGDQRLVPFLEVHPRSAWQAQRSLARLIESIPQRRHQRFGPRLRPDHGAEQADEIEDLLDAALIEDVHLDAGANQLARRCRPADRRSPAPDRA